MIRLSLHALIQRAKTTMVNQTGQDNPAIDALASAIAGSTFGQYAYQDYLFQQINPETADEEWLYIWAERVNQLRIPAKESQGFAIFTGAQGVVSIPEGTQLKTADDKHYLVTIATNSDQNVPIKSIEQGEAQNLQDGTSLYLVTAVSGLDPESITSYQVSSGANIEDVDHWRERIVSTFNQRQAVGTPKDYELWAKTSHADIDYAWALDNTPVLGKVTLYIGRRDNNPIVSNGIKQIAQNYIDSVRLAGCHVLVTHPTTKPINISINGVSNQTTREQITVVLQTLINEKLGQRSDLTPSEIILAITPITTNFGLTSPTSIQTLDNHQLFTLGAVTWN